VSALVEQIERFPRHLSIHPGGFLLGAEPVDTLVPIEPATMPGRTVIQWDKHDVEELGLFKVDLLGLGMLTQIHGCFDLLREHEGIELSLASVPPDDAPTFEMLSRADSVGVFQVESRAQMSMLPRLKPRSFYDLVVEVAIMRPGPIQGGMVHPYLKRREGREPITYPHPSFVRILEKTLGVPIFQEQVMKLAIEAADYTPGEADQLRRDMAAWGEKGRIEAHEERLVSRMIARGIPRPFAEQVFSQIRGFGEYGFPESHAASFAILSYVSAWLKCHHHAAFTCALLNAWPMGFYAPSTLIEDAKRHDVTIRPIDVSHSDWDCTLEPDPSHPPHAIRMGLRYVKGLGERERERLEAARPPYETLADFARRTRLGKRPLLALAETGAFASLGLDRRRALWAVRGLLSTDHEGLELSPTTLPEELPRFTPLRRGEAVIWDYETSRHSTHGHPMASLREALHARRVPSASRLNAMPGGRRLAYVGLVICRQRPHTARGVTFMTLEDETGFVNVVIWADVFDAHAEIVRSASLVEVRGTLQRANGVVHLIAESLGIPRLERPLPKPSSRDFH
jgi:error-prone DNA polymerase